MHSQFVSHPFRELLERVRLPAGVMKQWNVERLEIYFYWTSIFMMDMNKAHVIEIESAKILSDLEGHENAK